MCTIWINPFFGLLRKHLDNHCEALRRILPEPILTTLSCSFEVFNHGVVVNSTQDLLLHQTKLLSCGQLPLTRVARETCQVVCVSSRAAHPVTRIYLPPTAGTLSTKPTVRDREREARKARESNEEIINNSW